MQDVVVLEGCRPMPLEFACQPVGVSVRFTLNYVENRVLRTETEIGGARFHRAGHVKNVPHDGHQRPCS